MGPNVRNGSKADVRKISLFELDQHGPLAASYPRRGAAARRLGAASLAHDDWLEDLRPDLRTSELHAGWWRWWHGSGRGGGGGEDQGGSKAHEPASLIGPCAPRYQDTYLDDYDAHRD